MSGTARTAGPAPACRRAVRVRSRGAQIEGSARSADSPFSTTVQGGPLIAAQPRAALLSQISRDFGVCAIMGMEKSEERSPHAGRIACGVPLIADKPKQNAGCEHSRLRGPDGGRNVRIAWRVQILKHYNVEVLMSASPLTGPRRQLMGGVRQEPEVHIILLWE
jgi:hypothetical protein